MAIKSDKVTSITEFKNRDTKKVLRELLKLAETGEMTGLILGVRLGDWDHGIAITGSYAKDPVAGALVAGRLVKILSNRADKMVKPGKL
jgi:hypothetical protein